METHRESLEVLGLDEMSFFGVDPAELPKANVRLREGERVFNMDIVVLETPGHTPGSVCFYAEKEGILFSGDTLFFDGVGRTDMPGGSDRKLKESIQKKIAVLPPETRVFPGHGPFTTVEREKRGNPFFRVPPAPPRPEPAKPAVKKPPRSAAARKATRHAARPGSARRPAGAARAAGKTGRAKGGAGKAAKAGAASRRPRSSRPAPRRSPVRPKARTAPRSAAARRKASARPAGAAVRTRAVQTKAGKGVKRKARQATRSTKAPGKGRKPAR
jgi:hypothetical protein